MRTFIIHVRKRSFIDVTSATITATNVIDSTFNPVTVHLGDKFDKPIALTSRPRLAQALNNHFKEIGLISGDYIIFKGAYAAKVIGDDVVHTKKINGKYPLTIMDVDNMLDPASVAYLEELRAAAKRIEEKRAAEASASKDEELQTEASEDLSEVEDLNEVSYETQVIELLSLEDVESESVTDVESLNDFDGFIQSVTENLDEVSL